MRAGNKTYIDDPLVRTIQADGLHKLKQARNRAFVVVFVLLVCVAMLASAIVVLSNLRTVIPVVAVLDADGHIVRQAVVDKERMIAEESFVQGQVYNFIVYCNTFDPAWRQHYSDLCRLHASEDVARQYADETAPDNHDNPYYLIGHHSRRFPRITAIAKLNSDTYQVSFQSITEHAGNTKQVDYYTALVRYVFTAKPLALGDRWENPLGFAAIAYRKDQELSRQ